MNTADQETAAIKTCDACREWIAEESNYCRICGARQPNRSGSFEGLPSNAKVSQCSSATSYQTTRLPSQNLYHPVSGPLVKAVADGLPASLPGSHAKEIPKRLLLALMAIPIWVMIILLSPIDAYASAKIIGQRI